MTNPHPPWQGFRSLQQRFPRHLHCSEAAFRHAIAALQVRHKIYRVLAAQSLSAPSKNSLPYSLSICPRAQAAWSRVLPPVCLPTPAEGPGGPAEYLREAWERARRHRPAGDRPDGAFKLQAFPSPSTPPAPVDSGQARADAPRDRGPPRSAGCGGGSEPRPVAAGLASAPGPAPPPPPSAADSRGHGGAPAAPADGASGDEWVFWAGWVTEGCAGDGGGRGCGGGDRGAEPDGDGGGGGGGEGGGGGGVGQMMMGQIPVLAPAADAVGTGPTARGGDGWVSSPGLQHEGLCIAEPFGDSDSELAPLSPYD